MTNKKVIREPGVFRDTYRVFPMFGSIDTINSPPQWDARVMLSEGGWIGRRWMTTAELNAALERWVKRSYATALPEALTRGGEYQCGGCRFFGAFDGDYGLCCNPASENDGRVVFEHGGCPQASGIPPGSGSTVPVAQPSSGR